MERAEKKACLTHVYVRLDGPAVDATLASVLKVLVTMVELAFRLMKDSPVPVQLDGQDLTVDKRTRVIATRVKMAVSVRL